MAQVADHMNSQKELLSKQIPSEIEGVYSLLINTEKEFSVILNSRKNMAYHAKHLDVREPLPMKIYNLKGGKVLQYSNDSQLAILELQKGSFGVGREKEVPELKLLSRKVATGENEARSYSPDFVQIDNRVPFRKIDYVEVEGLSGEVQLFLSKKF